MITAAFTDGNALYMVLPNFEKKGSIIIKAEPAGSKLVLAHSCSKSHIAHSCPCVKEAMKCYRTWQWWDRKDQIILVNKHVTLQADWEQIPIPDSMAEIIASTIYAEGEYDYVTKHSGNC